MSRRLLEVETLAAFDRHIRRARRLNGWFVSSLDLTERSAALLAVDPAGAVFLGCQFAPEVEDRLRAAGALLFPRLPDLPFDPYRPRLYDAVELYGTGPVGAQPGRADLRLGPLAGGHRAVRGAGHARCTTTRSATPSTTRPPICDPRDVVGIMGGHALLRTDPAYAAAASAGRGPDRSRAARCSPAAGPAPWRPATWAPT